MVYFYVSMYCVTAIRIICNIGDKKASRFAERTDENSAYSAFGSYHLGEE